MNFKEFPFDVHNCDLDFGEADHYANDQLIMEPITIMYEDQLVSNFNGSIHIKDSHLPFNIEIIPKETFEVTNIDFLTSTTGVTFKFTRKSLGLLMGGFYGPTAAFTMLSMISFFINPDIVKLISTMHSGYIILMIV